MSKKFVEKLKKIDFSQLSEEDLKELYDEVNALRNKTVQQIQQRRTEKRKEQERKKRELIEQQKAEMKREEEERVRKITEMELSLKFYELVENYQYIEGWLEYIYAWFSKRGMLKGLEEVDKTNLRRLLELVKDRKNTAGEPIFTDVEISDLVRIVERRNFWIHSALFDLPFDNRTDELKKDCHKQQMEEDLGFRESIARFFTTSKMLCTMLIRIANKKTGGFYG